jgi:predicted transcriptional regulator
MKISRIRLSDKTSRLHPQRLAEGATQADLARTYRVSQATISRLQPLPFGGASVAVA